MKLLRNENDVVELAGQIQSYLPEGMETEQIEKAVDYQLQSIIGRQISVAHGLIANKQKLLDQAVVKLQDALDGFDGSEVRDQQVQRATGWVRQQEAQLNFLIEYCEEDMLLAQAAYQDYFGKSWMPYSESRNIAAKMKVTAAAVDAQELLAHYKK